MSGLLFGPISFHHFWLRNTGPPLQLLDPGSQDRPNLFYCYLRISMVNLPSMWIIGATAYRVPLQADSRSPGPLMLQCGYTQILKLRLGWSIEMEIPGSTRRCIPADKLSVPHASWPKSKILSIALYIALSSSTLITWCTLCVFRMITVPIYRTWEDHVF